MRHKSKSFPINTEIDGRELAEAVTSYLAAQFPNAKIENQSENNTYTISFVQDAEPIKIEKKPASRNTKVICSRISICLTDRLCKVEIETDAFRINRRNPKDKVLNLLLSAGTVGAIVIFPGITPFVMSGIAGAGIVAIANSMETKLFRFIKDYINA